MQFLMRYLVTLLQLCYIFQSTKSQATSFVSSKDKVGFHILNNNKNNNSNIMIDPFNLLTEEELQKGNTN